MTDPQIEPSCCDPLMYCAGFPLVLLDRSLPERDCDLVVSDSVSGARHLAEHLISVGHHSIAHLTRTTPRRGATGSEATARLSPLQASPRATTSSCRTTVDQLGGYRASQEVLALDPRPTAIFAVNT